MPSITNQFGFNIRVEKHTRQNW